MSIREDLKAFVDGELDPTRASEVQAAVEKDPALQQEVHFMKLLSKVIIDEAKEPDIKGADDALKAVRKPSAFTPRRVMWGLLGTVGALAILAVLFPVFGQSKFAAKSTSDLAASSVAMETASPAASSQISKSMPVPGHVPFVGGGRPESEQSDVRANGQVTVEGVPATTPAGADEGVESNGKLSSTTRAKGSTIQPSSTSPQDQAKTKYMAPPAQSNHKIIQNGDLDVVVDDVSKAQTEATNAAVSASGFVENSSLDYDQDSQPIAKLTLRVPVARFSSVLQRLTALGKVKSDHVTGQDVSAQFADTEGRLKVLGAEEDSYVTMLRGAKSIGQILEIKDRLSSVRQEIASLQSQKEVLKDQSAMSTLNLTLEQKPKVGKAALPPPDPTADNWATDSWSSAVSGMSSAMRFTGQVFIFLFVYSPIWLPIVFVVWLLARWAKKQ